MNFIIQYISNSRSKIANDLSKTLFDFLNYFEMLGIRSIGYKMLVKFMIDDMLMIDDIMMLIM